MIIDLKFYWRLLMRRLPAMLAIVMLCSALGIVQAIRMPPTFETAARLLVESPIVEENGSPNASADEEIQIIREQLLTRSNLLDIGEEFDVFEDYSALPPDEIVSLMQASTSITNRGGRDQATVITVSFSARTGQIAADVVNEYVTRIIDASARRNRELDEGNLNFYQQEVDRLSGELSRQSASITQFQAQNADALPGEQTFRLQRQATLQERISSAQRELSSLIDQRSRIVEIYEQTGQVGGPETVLTDDQRQLRDLERQLAQQLTIYSESAPQIVTLRRRIDQLREQVSSETNPDAPVSSSQAVLNLQLSQLDTQIFELEGVISEAERELTGLEDAIMRTPQNASRLEEMQRNYENARALYERAADNLQQAQIDLRITETNRGQRITLVESANVPRYPASPNRKLIAFLGGMVGVGLACVLFALMEILNRAVRHPVEFTKALGIEPLITIPYMETRMEKLRRISFRVAAMLLIIVGLPAGLWAVDSYYMPLDQLAGLVLDRLGVS